MWVCLLIVLLSLSASAAQTQTYVLSEGEGGFRLEGENGDVLCLATTPEKVLSFLEESQKNSELCIPALVKLENITLNETWNVTGSQILFSGKIRFTGQAKWQFSDGAQVVLSDIDVDFSGGEGYLRLKDATLQLESGTIRAGTRYAVVSDYASSAKFYLHDGRLENANAYPTLYAGAGTAYLDGGEVVNGLGDAVYSSSTLHIAGQVQLCGKRRDVVSSGTVFLRDGDTPMATSVNVYTDKTFTCGQITPVLYRASAEQAALVRLFDSAEKEIPLCYFEAYEGIDETSFLSP